MTTIVELRNIIKWFPPNQLVFDHLNLKISAGEKILMTGHAGSGKSCLANLICGNMVYDSGEIIRLVDISIIPEHSGWIKTFSVVEYMALPLIAKGCSLKRSRAEAYKMMQRLGISERGNARVQNLTSFEKAEIMVGQALLQESDLIVADTFMVDLNEKEKKKILSLLLENLWGKALLLMSDCPFYEEEFDRVIDLTELQGEKQW